MSAAESSHRGHPSPYKKGIWNQLITYYFYKYVIDQNMKGLTVLQNVKILNQLLQNVKLNLLISFPNLLALFFVNMQEAVECNYLFRNIIM